MINHLFHLYLHSSVILTCLSFIFLLPPGMTRETQCWNGPLFLLINPTEGTYSICFLNTVLLLYPPVCSYRVGNTYCFFFFSIFSGSMEFSVPAADPSTFFPISVGFFALNTFSSLKVGYIYFLVIDAYLLLHLLCSSASGTTVEFAWLSGCMTVSHHFRA